MTRRTGWRSTVAPVASGARVVLLAALAFAACDAGPVGTPPLGTATPTRSLTGAATGYPGCPFVDPAMCVTPPPSSPLPTFLATERPPPSHPIAGSMLFAIGACLLNTAGAFALDDIAALGPDVMLWLGDNIYADTQDPGVMRALYDQLGANPRFKALAETTAMMAVWDDHDYGWNNANRLWSFRDGAKAEFDRFWGVPEGDPRRSQPGVYSARTFGSGDRTVQVILLDVRYNLDPYDYAGVDPARTILGAEQWAWLEERLAEPATIRLIGSGIQVVNDYDIDPQPEWEGWEDSPIERQRLFDLIRGLGLPGIVFVSGDMHFAELTRHPDDARALGYPTYDLTPSGLDRIETWSPGEWINPDRVGELLNTDRKFGTVEIDWEQEDPEIHLRIHDGPAIFLDHVVRLSELRPG